MNNSIPDKSLSSSYSQRPLKKMHNLFKNRGIQVVFCIFAYLSLAPILPTIVNQILYTISLLIKDLLLWVLPLCVGFFIANTLAAFERRAPLFIILLFVFEALSNFSTVWYAYGSGCLAIHNQPVLESTTISDGLCSLLSLSKLKPTWWSADKGTFVGIAIGLLASFKPSFLKNFLLQGKQISEKILTKFFSRLIPLFILGFVARMYQTQLLNQLMNRYLALLFWLILILLAYIAFLFLLGSGFSLKTYLKNIKNLLPAGGIAFSSGCSLSTIPWTIEGTAKNLKDPSLANTVIPATTNIQQVGDCIANSFLCFLIYYSYFGAVPSISTWISFSLIFILARFATAAVLGGSIFIMLPIYESYLGFNNEMIALILALNVILDPLITCTNVIANGALCRVFERIWNKLNNIPLFKKIKSFENQNYN